MSRGKSAADAVAQDHTAGAKDRLEGEARAMSGVDQFSEVESRRDAVEGDVMAKQAQVDALRDDPSGVANDRVTAEGKARIESAEGQARAAAQDAAPERATAAVAEAEAYQAEAEGVRARGEAVAAAADDPQRAAADAAASAAKQKVQDLRGQAEGEHGVSVSVDKDGVEGDAD
jgi:hypothetical protein